MKEPMIPSQEKDEWAQKPAGLLWGTEKSLAPIRNHTLDLPAHSVTTIPSSLPKCAIAPACTHTHTIHCTIRKDERMCVKPG